MRQFMLALLMITAYLGVISSSLADLNNATYVLAKQRYSESNFPETLALLSKYKAEDASFLASNPEISIEIDKVIAFCKSASNSTLILGGLEVVEVDPAPRPTLP